MLNYTQLKENNRKNLRDIIPLKKPFTLIAEPSSRCNFRCSMCFQSTQEHPYFHANKKHMPFDLFAQIVEQGATWGEEPFQVLKLSLYGEPLLNPDFCKMLALANERNIAKRIETTSNVSLLTPEISEGLVRGGLHYLRVSIYAPTQERHEQITASNIDISVIKNNLEALQNIKQKYRSSTPFVAVKMLDTYGEENERFRQMYQDVADEIYIEKPHNWVGAPKNDFMQSLYGSDNSAAILDLAAQDNHCLACGPSFYTLAVRNNGDVAPCCVDWTGSTNIGNITEDSLQNIWQGETMRAFWKMQLLGQNADNPACRTCKIYKSSYYAKDNVDHVPIERLEEKDA